MSGCATHGQLVGGYVLGALEPGEMEEMRRHVAGCPQCGPEAERLAALPGLLDRIAPADVPPPALAPQVEEAVLDRVARERREQAAGRRRGGFGRRPGRRRLLRPGRRALAFGAAAVAALALALVLLLPEDDDGDPAYASVRLARMAAATPGAAASAELAEVPAGTRIRLRTRGLHANDEYEVWCIRADGRWISGGTFWTDRDGRTQAELTAAVRPGDYHRMVVTRPPDGGGDSRGPAVLGGELRY